MNIFPSMLFSGPDLIVTFKKCTELPAAIELLKIAYVFHVKQTKTTHRIFFSGKIICGLQLPGCGRLCSFPFPSLRKGELFICHVLATLGVSLYEGV